MHSISSMHSRNNTTRSKPRKPDPSKSKKQDDPPAALPTMDNEPFAPVQATPRPLESPSAVHHSNTTHHPSSVPISHRSWPRLPSLVPHTPAAMRYCSAKKQNSNNTPRYKPDDPNLTQENGRNEKGNVKWRNSKQAKRYQKPNRLTM
ncbi:hypothetical protein N657DRAFT_498646 [Parathielavia appendiculata]|uniref:Uncharacterized protein n=1 Tax=Parathielavia appendiculata TaxID=2587402 RepID=A0AAN6Z287_9PEZI|nr:hypothetical protein N657DRAFT_498646 [Parathielavia appendiculata]